VVSFGIFWSGQSGPRGAVGSAHATKRIFLRSGVLWLVESSELKNARWLWKGD
jgi:hypothetical protein